MASEHTQEPWSYEAEQGFCTQISGADGRVVCCFDEDPNEADSRLMTAAPELLKALKALLYWDNGKSEYDEARAAIAKATGATHD